ncbi:hypothetical protein [Streptomyces sp. IMTB 2501]|uniref:hypothetical protein n=1 Tax=Streptomyces sp. IMTB 2501 TaxID=1776340 RepID=UPI0011810352|nr:hypothetical protein [Streptomyces sp. IMTB 2501]
MNTSTTGDGGRPLVGSFEHRRARSECEGHRIRAPQQPSCWLAADLGYLPLALKQAGSYLNRNRGIALDAYRRSLGTKLHKADDDIAAERTISRIWHLTLHILASRDPLAVDVLYTAAWLAPDNVPHALLAPHGTDPDDLAEAIGTLASYSMATDTGTTLSIHRLVQTVLRPPKTPVITGPKKGARELNKPSSVTWHHLPARRRPPKAMGCPYSPSDRSRRQYPAWTPQ